MIENELETLVDLHYSVVNHRTTEIMRTLTVIAGIFLPLTFITGFFGMNFDNMTILHSPYGYYASITGMGLLGLILFAIFKWKKWV
jgi:Mg2+ and Co2+ transporter CorA